MGPRASLAAVVGPSLDCFFAITGAQRARERLLCPRVCRSQVCNLPEDRASLLCAFVFAAPALLRAWRVIQ